MFDKHLRSTAVSFRFVGWQDHEGCLTFADEANVVASSKVYSLLGAEEKLRLIHRPGEKKTRHPFLVAVFFLFVPSLSWQTRVFRIGTLTESAGFPAGDHHGFDDVNTYFDYFDAAFDRLHTTGKKPQFFCHHF
jgi:hypothetical protein